MSPRSLKSKVSLYLTLVLVAVMMLFVLLLVQQERGEQLRTLVTHMEQLSQVIARSTRHAMLLDQPEIVEKIIEDIGKQDGIKRVRVLRKDGVIASIGNAAGLDFSGNVMPFILRGVHLLGVNSSETPMPLRQTIWNKLAVEWRPDRVHDQVRTIDFDELPTHFDPYLKGLVRGRTVVRIGSDTHP